MCPNYEPEGQERGSTFRVCHALKKIAILLNKSLIPSHLKWPALYGLIKNNYNMFSQSVVALTIHLFCSFTVDVSICSVDI